MPAKELITKELLVEAVTEAIESKREIFLDVFEEAIENIVIDRAIEEGYKTKTVPKKEIIELLKK